MSEANTPNQSMTAFSFLNTIGSDTHIAYTDGGYANIQNVLADLAYLGISQVRDGISNGENGSAPLSSYIEMAQAGIRFSFIIDVSNTASLDATLSLINQVEAAVPGSVIAIEGPNEINNQPVTYNGVSGLQGALNEQGDIYAAVHSDATLTGVPVDYFTGYDAGGVATGPDPSVTAGLADYDNAHPYPNFGQAPAAWVARSTALVNESPPNGPAVYTETGYSTNQVNPDVQAKYELDLLMDTASEGISKTFLYELMDAYAPGSPQGDAGWGLFDYTKVPKLAGTAIHNLTTLLQDSGATASSFVPTPFNYSLVGLPATGNVLLLQKSDGTNIVSIWNEPQIWNNNTGVETIVPAVPVTVDLSTTYASVDVFDPLFGTAPIASYRNVSSVTIGVTDHPILVEVSQNALPAASTAAGLDTLVLNLSEDSYAGDAQVMISVDGQLLGDVETVTALHSAGASQNLTFTGSFGTGNHTVAVDFLNDLYDGTPTTDRNLYVNSITLDGTTVTENAAQLSQGTALYSIIGAAVAQGQTSSAAAGTSTSGTASTATLASSSATAGAPVATVAAVTTITSGSDTLVLNLSEIAASGKNAAFTVSVDGTQIGGTQTATASEVAGASQTISLSGNFGTGAHTVTIDYLDGFTGAAADAGRVLYLNAITIDNQTTFPDAPLRFDGNTNYAVQIPATPVASNAGSVDTLVLNLSETAVSGADAQFMVSVDGQLVGAVQTVTASHAAGQSQNVTLTGDFGSGSHVVTINFVNGFGGAAADVGRSLYVNSITLDGAVTAENALQTYIGAQSYTVIAGTALVSPPTPIATPPTPVITTPTNPGTATSGSDTLVLDVSEIAASGKNAAFTVSVDGTQIGGTQTATASEVAGASQTISLSGNFGTGSHTVTIDYLDGFTGAAADAGRVLYLNAITIDNQTTFPDAPLRFDGNTNYAVQIPATPVASDAGSADTLVLNLSETAVSGADAQFMVSVDGQLVGAVQTVTASHAAGHSQNVTLTGDFGSGPHVVTINFVNGFGGAAADVGRSLYVNSITLDGVVTAENALQTYIGAQSYTLTAGIAPISAPTPIATAPTPVIAAPTISISSQVLANDTGARATDNITSDGAVTLSGSVTGSSGTTVEVYSGTTALGAATISNGLWSYSTILAAGTYALYAVATDPVGDTAKTASEPSISVETTAPTVTIAQAVQSQNSTNVTVSGTVSGATGSTVEIYNRSTALGAAILDGKGGWTYSTSLAPGTYYLEATATDLAGNAASASDPAFTVVGASTSVSVAPDIVSANVSTGTGITQQTVNVSAASSTSGTFVPTSPAGSIGASALVTYNWNPAVQLSAFLAARTNSQAGTPATIVAIGDSTTRGYGASALGWSALSYVSEMTQALNQDGVAAQSDNFFGSGVSLSNGLVEDNRITLVNGATTPFAIDAGGLTVSTTAVGQGLDFSLNSPGNYNRVSISYIDVGSGSVTVSVDGGPVLQTLQFGNTGQTLTQTIDIPAGTYAQLNIRAATANTTYIEGASFWNSSSSAISVSNAGIDGWDSGSANSSIYNGTTLEGSTNGFGETAGVAAAKPNLVLIDLGINDMVHALDTTAQTVANLTQMIASLRSVGSDVILVIPQPFSDPTYATELPALRSAMQALSTAQDVPLIDLSATYGNNYAALAAAGLMSDDLHPDATLYADIGSQIAALLANAINASPTAAAVSATKSQATMASVVTPQAAAPATITGTTGADTLDGTTGADVFDGKGGDDYEQGNGGSDTFIYNLGYGSLEINESGTAVSVLQLGPGITPGDVSVTSDPNNDLIITDGTPGDIIKIDGMLGSSVNGVQQIQFIGGTQWTASQMRFTAQMGTSGSDTILGTSGNDVIDGRGGGDTVTGNGGSDTYIFRQGYGQLQIINATASGLPASGQVDFGSGLSESNLWFSRVGNNLNVTALNSHDQVIVQGWFGSNLSAALAGFVGGDGLKLDTGITQLVAAMATYQNSNPGFNPASAAAMPTDRGLQAAILAAWHT